MTASLIPEWFANTLLFLTLYSYAKVMEHPWDKLITVIGCLVNGDLLENKASAVYKPRLWVVSTETIR